MTSHVHTSECRAKGGPKNCRVHGKQNAEAIFDGSYTPSGTDLREAYDRFFEGAVKNQLAARRQEKDQLLRAAIGDEKVEVHTIKVSPAKEVDPPVTANGFGVSVLPEMGSVRGLREGDVLGQTGETVVNCWRDTKTRKGYMSLILKNREGKRRQVEWNASTQVQFFRVPSVSALPVMDTMSVSSLALDVSSGLKPLAKDILGASEKDEALKMSRPVYKVNKPYPKLKG